ncbi:hypothetical protein [Runella sp.]|jgi:hypothetical protein|uniref:hypothetical protein n=1 Tax=Runella sp. TaxID=1960881 RepID=UPI00262FB272|nr:hypothetical protein [Runella sp.]
MQNQKLFDKIRASLADEETLKQEPLEWSKENVWQKIEQRQHQKNKKLWGPLAATAALVVLMGGYVWFLAVVEVENPNKNRLSVVGKQREINKIVPVQTKKKVTDFKFHKSEKVLDSEPMSKDTFAVFSLPISLADVKNTSKQDSVPPTAPASEMQPVVENKPKKRVLVVDIDLPDAPPTADHLLKTTFLQRFSQQARRLKTERKFDIKALDRKPGNGIWSFVGQSFVIPDAKQ